MNLFAGLPPALLRKLQRHIEVALAGCDLTPNTVVNQGEAPAPASAVAPVAGLSPQVQAPGLDLPPSAKSLFPAVALPAFDRSAAPTAPAPLAPSFEGADTSGELEVGLDHTGRCPSCGVARFTMHRDGCKLIQPQPKRVWTATEDAVLLDGLCGHGLILPLVDRLGRTQTDCLARLDQLVPAPQTRDAMRTALRMAREAA